MGLLVEEQPYYIACEGRFSQFAQGLRSWLEDGEITILTDDAKKLYSAFLPEGIGMKALYWDSLLIAYLLNPESKDLSLEALLAEQFNVTLPEDPVEHLCGLLKRYLYTQ